MPSWYSWFVPILLRVDGTLFALDYLVLFPPQPGVNDILCNSCCVHSVPVYSVFMVSDEHSTVCLCDSPC